MTIDMFLGTPIRNKIGFRRRLTAGTAWKRTLAYRNKSASGHATTMLDVVMGHIRVPRFSGRFGARAHRVA